MTFSVMVSLLVVVFCLIIDNEISAIADGMNTYFGAVFLSAKHIFINADTSVLEGACPGLKDQMLELSTVVSYFKILIIISGLGYLTAILQKLVVWRLKDNV